MLEPVALHQTGFKVPGLAQDARGIVVSTQAATLLLGLDRLVALLRLLSEELQLDDVLPSLRIELVRNPLGAQAYLLRLSCADSLLLDRLARTSRLCGAVFYVGAGKHFVPYRDRHAPLGYDAREPPLPTSPADAADYVLYSEASAQPFARVREVALLQLLAQLTLIAVPGGASAALRTLTGALPGATPQGPGPGRADAETPLRPAELAGGAADDLSVLPEPLWLTLPLGLVTRLGRYLWERGAGAELVPPDALPPPDSATPPAQEELALLRLTRIRSTLLHQLLTLPGLRLYQAVGDRLAIELGYTHPLRVAALASLFAADRLQLFSGSQRGWRTLPASPLIPIERLIELRHELRPQSAAPTRERDEAGAPLRPRPVAPTSPAVPPAGAPVVLRVPLQLVAQPGAGGQSGRRAPTATLVPWQRALWLSRLLYTLPAALLGGLQAACIDEGVLVLGASGVQALPLGTLLYEPTAGVFIPLGWELLPRLPGELLAAQLGGTDERCLVFLPGQAQPLALPRALLKPLSQQLLSPSLPTPRAAVSHGEPLDPELQNSPVSALSTFALWPLWGRLGDDGA